MKKIMLDKDALIELLDKSDPGYKPVAKILSENKKLKLKVFLGDFTLKEIYGYVNEKKGEKEAKEAVRLLLQLVRIISPIEKNFRRAVGRADGDFDTALLCQVAEDNHIDYIITSDIKRFRGSKLPVLNAEQLLSSI